MAVPGMPGKNGWLVHKFGGSSVASAERYAKVASIVLGHYAPAQAVVVSAMSKVTDHLIELLTLAAAQDAAYLDRLVALQGRHETELKDLLSPHRELSPGSFSASRANRTLEEMLTVFSDNFSDLSEILRAVYLTRSYSKATLDFVSGLGEVWSAQLLKSYLVVNGRSAVWLDARSVLKVEHPQIASAAPAILWDESSHLVRRFLLDSKLPLPYDAKNGAAKWGQKEGSTYPLLIVTGFVASFRDGVATTLGRNGSDYSGSIFGSLLSAEEIVIWTDVDGVLSADPRLVPEATVLSEMSYAEATELAYFGAKVVHPATMAPAIHDKIPIWIKNTFNDKAPGTKIHAAPAQGGAPIKGFSTIEKVALINVEGRGMIGVPGVAQRLFGAIKDAGISVNMISQASSEHSICFAVAEDDGEAARAAAEGAFFKELKLGQIERVELLPGVSILAAVGDNLIGMPGVAATFFKSLAQAGVNVRMVAQGSSERNISVVVDRKDHQRALRAAHAGFYLSPHRVGLALVGYGMIGSTFLAQLAAQRERLLKDHNVDIRLLAVANSQMLVLGKGDASLSFDPDDIKKSLTPAPQFIHISHELGEHLKAANLPHTLIVDCSSSSEVTEYYPRWLEDGFHVIAANKNANSGPLANYQEIRSKARRSRAQFLYETNVGAGLPVISTIRDLVGTGDAILAIEGVFSGTLSYIFNKLTPGESFSETVKDAQRRGYTEPDPRDDLSGMDVARKLVILAREMGLPLSLEDVKVESLIPPEIADREAVSKEDFILRLAEFNGKIGERLKEEAASGKKLRYVASVNAKGEASVCLKAVDADHPLASLTGANNLIHFRTARYNDYPLVIQGPGAGAHVTAAGVFSDLLRLLSHLGAYL